MSDCYYSANYLCCVEPDQQPHFKFQPLCKYPILDESAASSVEVPIGFQNLSSVVILDQEYLDIVIDIEHSVRVFGWQSQFTVPEGC
jgi:hypothetical protein